MEMYIRKARRYFMKYANLVKKSQEARLKRAKFPSKAFDLNKLPETDILWKIKVDDISRLTALRNLSGSKEFGDVVFWLNNVGDNWKNDKTRQAIKRELKI